MLRRIVVACLCLSAVLPPAAAGQTPLQVFVSVPPQRYLVQRIGGDHVRLHVMLEPGSAPETFDPSLRQLERLAAADVYFMIGVPFESRWIGKLRRTAPGVRFVPCCENILAANETSPDPHIWTSPVKALALSRRILEVLVQEDPAHRAEFAANHEQLRADLIRLDAYARERLNKRRTEYFITVHAAWGHLALEYGLRETSVERNGREIGSRGMSRLLSLARREGIDTVFFQPQHGIARARTLAARLQADLVELDPLAADYLDNMTAVIDRIAGAVQ